MSTWYPIEIYSLFIRVCGDIEVIRPLRLSDTLNRISSHLELRNATVDPLSSNFPVLAHPQLESMLAKSGITIVCPTKEPSPASNPALWREKIPQTYLFTTQTFSLMAEAHLDLNESLTDHLERYPNDFLPLTNISALWIAGAAAMSHAIQRPFGLLNPATIVSFTAQ